MSGAGLMGAAVLGTLRRERERQGISKSELCRRLGWSRSSFSVMEDGGHLPTFSRLMQWCAALGLEIRIERNTAVEPRVREGVSE